MKDPNNFLLIIVRITNDVDNKPLWKLAHYVLRAVNKKLLKENLLDTLMTRVSKITNIKILVKIYHPCSIQCFSQSHCEEIGTMIIYLLCE